LAQAGLGMSDCLDAKIITRAVNGIAAALMAAFTHAAEHGDEVWLQRHRWFSDACERLNQMILPLSSMTEPVSSTFHIRQQLYGETRPSRHFPRARRGRPLGGRLNV
jgi:hypothetical protein